MKEYEIIAEYEKYEALLTGHFLLSSGLHSDKYLQSEKVMMYPRVAEQIVKPLVEKLDFYYTAVVSPAVGGIRFGYELARQADKRSLFTERVDGVMQFRRGFELVYGERVVVAEDVVTTGKSTKECIEAVKKAGGVVVAVVSIIDRSSGNANFDVPFIPLANIEVQTWPSNDCPLCKTGGTAIKPGSRAGLK